MTPTTCGRSSTAGSRRRSFGVCRIRTSARATRRQIPEDGTWSRNDLNGAKIVATNSDATAAITVFERLDYHAVYISSMPEYRGGTDDLQFAYNAITFPRPG